MEWLTVDDVLVVIRTDAEVRRLEASVARNGRSGGFQNLQRYHLDHLVGGHVCIIKDPVWVERTIRYCTCYGTGGYQRNTGGRGRYGSER